MRAPLLVVLALPACSQCTAACLDSFKLTLRGGRMSASAYDFVVAFDGREFRGRCTVGDRRCTTESSEMRLLMSQSSFDVVTFGTPANVRVDLTWSTGSTRLELSPSYEKGEVCGMECRSAVETRQVTSW